MSKTRAEAVASLLLALACLFGPVGSVRARQAARQVDWARYTFEQEEFSVMLPSVPFIWRLRRLLPGRRGDTETGRVFGVYADGVVYTVTSYDNPRPSETLDYFVKELQSRTPWELKPRESAAVTHGGREYFNSFECAGGRATCEETSRIFRTGEHAYIVSAFAEVGRQEAVKKFLDSFALSAKPEGQLVIAGPPVLAPFRVSDAEPKPKGEPKPRATPAPSPTPATSDAAPPPPAADPNRALAAREVARKAVIVFKPEPGYTEKARKNDVEGVVRLKMVLGADGRVSDIVLVKKLPDGLTERALLAAQHILFIPAQKDGRRVSQWITVEYSFNIY